MSEERRERRIRVRASGSYDVVVGRGLIGRVGELVRDAEAAEGRSLDGTCLVVSDDNVGPLYADAACASLRAAGFDAHDVRMPAGEATKCLARYGELLGAAADAGLTRSGLVVALGGGVIGDLAGFVAATYMRGCRLVQVATSLLAMVDSSVGGKTAIDLPQGKNLAGAFLQPDLVVCDLDALRTLPASFLSDGTGEVVKYGIMCDPELFAWLEAPVMGQEGRVVARCVAIKRDVVEADEREAGERKRLNLGHTVGHAIERCSGYTIPHGHAVAAGCAIMARACAAHGLCAGEDAARIVRMIAGHGLPTTTTYGADELYAAALHDKKRVGDGMDVVLVRGVGATEIRRVSLPELREIIEEGL